MAGHLGIWYRAEMDDKLSLQFLGAAETVTGSKYLLTSGTSKLLVDCGLFQGEKELRLRNWNEPPFTPREISAVVLTHAHVDHSGYLPLLARRGFQGPIYCTPATKGLLTLLLPDSAHLQEEEARFANKHGTSKHIPARPLYTAADAARALALLTEMEFDQPQTLAPDLVVTPSTAGHILGSACLTFDIRGRRITFSGDLGRYGAPLMRDPAPVTFGDLLVCESTYGDRTHAQGNPSAELARVINSTAAKNGALIIPAFALGRTQTLLYLIAGLERKGVIPGLPVYVDSPMAVDATQLYIKYSNEYDQTAADLLASGKRVLRTAQTVFCRTVEESKGLNALTGARIIISASGMATGGRVLHHLRRLLPDRSTTVLLAGYQAEGTRGRSIQNGEPIRIFGEEIEVRAAVETISELSAHADADELMRWLRSGKGAPKTVRIVHGEADAARCFAERLQRELSWQTLPARDGECLDL